MKRKNAGEGTWPWCWIRGSHIPQSSPWDWIPTVGTILSFANVNTKWCLSGRCPFTHVGDPCWVPSSWLLAPLWLLGAFRKCLSVSVAVINCGGHALNSINTSEAGKCHRQWCLGSHHGPGVGCLNCRSNCHMECRYNQGRYLNMHVLVFWTA